MERSEGERSSDRTIRADYTKPTLTCRSLYDSRRGYQDGADRILLFERVSPPGVAGLRDADSRFQLWELR
jgi:hypothetical protein